MYTYFLILNDFGIRPATVWKLSEQRQPRPKDTDVYDPSTCAKDAEGVPNTTTCYGNTNWGVDQETNESAIDNPNLETRIWHRLAWDKTRNSKVDIRLFYAGVREPESWAACRWDPSADNDKVPGFYKYSHVSENWPICYSTEALKFAQAGYLVSIVVVQWSDLMICKTRNLSLSQQGMVNTFGNFGLFFETALVAILLYVPFLNIALGTRQIPFPHFGLPSFSFYVAIFFYDELRKIWLRGGMERVEGKLKLTGWIV